MQAGVDPSVRNDEDKLAVELIPDADKIAGGLAFGKTNGETVALIMQTHAGLVKPSKYPMRPRPYWLDKVNQEEREELERIARAEAEAAAARAAAEAAAAEEAAAKAAEEAAAIASAAAATATEGGTEATGTAESALGEKV